MKHLYCALCFVSCVLLLAGCSKKPDGFPAIYPCSVTVVNGTTPIEGATVLFHYENNSNAIVTVTGQTDSSGVAKMRSIQASYDAPGAPAGKCKVIVKKIPFLPDTKTDEEKRAMTINEAEAYKQSRVDEAAKLPREVPAILESSTNTPISQEISAPKSEFTINVADYQ